MENYWKNIIVKKLYIVYYYIIVFCRSSKIKKRRICRVEKWKELKCNNIMKMEYNNKEDHCEKNMQKYYIEAHMIENNEI